jgi:hypothetical protein
MFEHESDQHERAAQPVQRSGDSETGELSRAIHAGPRMTAQRASVDAVQRSARMSAQQKSLAILSGEMAEQEEEPVAQAKAAPGGQVVQRVKFHQDGKKNKLDKAKRVPKRKPFAKSFKRRGATGPGQDEIAEYESIKRLAKEYADKVRPHLEDDDEISEFNMMWFQIRTQGEDIAKLVQHMLAAPKRPDGVRPRRASARYLSSDVHKVKYQEDYLASIVSAVRELRRLAFALRASFVISAGGFGAKGRAHGTLGATSHGRNDQYNGTGQRDDHFLDGIEINGSKLTDHFQVRKDRLTAQGERAGPLVVAGQSYQPGADRKGLIAQADAHMKKLNANDSGPWLVRYENAPMARDRGMGQYANMNNTNANGYAWAANVPGWQNQRWEWLHVRGAGLGGHTDGSNLVLGTRDANTHMIPFESNVRTLAAEVGRNPHYQDLTVKWQVRNATGHLVDRIGLQWEMVPKDPSTKKAHGTAIFQPLATNANISKSEVDLIESALKLAREQHVEAAH